VAAEASLPETEDLQVLIERALSGDAACVRTLVDRLSPVIMKRVQATLWRRTGRASARQEAADMAQDVFVALFQADGRALRSWEPARGMSFDNFVGLLAQHQVVSILRNKRTSPWRDELTATAEIEPLGAMTISPEAITSSREDLRLLIDRLRETLSPRGLELFQRMVVDDEPLDALADSTGLTRDALYQWKSRLLRTVRALAEDIGGKNTKGRTSGGSGGLVGAVLLSETIALLRMVKGDPWS
jgi:RNA polymerase sigma factor (sigma-70 family)